MREIADSLVVCYTTNMAEAGKKVNSMIHKYNVKLFFLISGLIFSCLSSSLAMAIYDFKEESTLTDGKGIFYVTVKNSTSKKQKVSLYITFTSNSPTFVHEHRFITRITNSTTIATGETSKVPLMKPLLSIYPKFKVESGEKRLDITGEKVRLFIYRGGDPDDSRINSYVDYDAKYFDCGGYSTYFLDIPDAFVDLKDLTTSIRTDIR
jgi:hypothetical protein